MIIIIILNDRQLEKVSSIFENVGLVFFGSMVIPLLIDESNLDMITAIIGITLSIVSWRLSISILGYKYADHH